MMYEKKERPELKYLLECFQDWQNALLADVIVNPEHFELIEEEMGFVRDALDLTQDTVQNYAQGVEGLWNGQ